MIPPRPNERVVQRTIYATWSRLLRWISREPQKWAKAREVRFWSTTFRPSGAASRSPRFGASEPRGGLPVQGLFSTGMRIPSRFRRELLPRRFGLLPPFLGGGPLAMATIAVAESVGRGAAVRLLPCRDRR